MVEQFTQSAGDGRQSILVTGASGFVGRHFIEAVKEDFIVYAIARQSMHKAGIESHPNIFWLRADLADRKSVCRVMDEIAAEGGVSFIFHFAGYYDYTNRDNPEYRRTNVDGTRHLLEFAHLLQPKRFIYASSLAVSRFRPDDTAPLDEQSPADADIPYARSKKEAEELVADYSGQLPCAIVRLAAIFSDWCEYGPLYALLERWIGKDTKCRPAILAGRGRSALPYLHVQDLNRLLKRIMARHDKLPRSVTLLASPDGCTSHEQLYAIASRYAWGRLVAPIFVPKAVAVVGVAFLQAIGFLFGREPFEKVWMLRYVDLLMPVKARATREMLDWKPLERYHVSRRLLFLIQNMKSNPVLWEQKNWVMAHKIVEERPGLAIYEVMLAMKEKIIAEHVEFVNSEENRNRFPSYQALERETLLLRARYIYELLELFFLTGDRRHMLCYAGYLAKQRMLEGISRQELTDVLEHTARETVRCLQEDPRLKRFGPRIRDQIGMTVQMMIDEIEEVYHQQKNGRSEAALSCQGGDWVI